MSKPTPHRKRCKRWDIPHGAHLLTFSCLGRKPFLESDRSRQWFLDALVQARQKIDFQLWAWVLMPEHVHLVVCMGDQDRISDLLQSVKNPVARKAIRWVRKNAPDKLNIFLSGFKRNRPQFAFWLPGGGYERYLRSPRDIHEKIRYVHRNPVRRGLVERARDWPWSSCLACEERIDEPIPIDRETIPTVVNFD